MARVKWPSKKLKHFQVPLFGGSVFVAYDEDTYDQALDFLNVENSLGRCGGQVMMLENTTQGNVIYMVGIFTHDGGVVAHEAVHVAQMVMDYAGSQDNETQAYLTQSIYYSIEESMPKEQSNEE